MGHRANFIVVKDGLATAYHDQWAALGCLDFFTAGPDDAIDVLSDFEPTTELLDWAFAEGGYLIDFDERTAILFGSPVDESEFDIQGLDATQDEDDAEDTVDEPTDVEPEDFDPREFLEHLAPAWKGWKLIFDQRGVDAFADYLKSSRIDGIKCQTKSHPADVEPPCEFQA
jgi:hypothetical protein